MPLGSDSDAESLSLPLARHGVLSSGRQAVFGHGRLSAEKRPGSDKAHVSGVSGV